MMMYYIPSTSLLLLGCPIKAFQFELKYKLLLFSSWPQGSVQSPFTLRERSSSDLENYHFYRLDLGVRADLMVF